MTKKFIAGLLSALIFLPGIAMVQEDQSATAFAYATYFVCSPGAESRADEVINTTFKPHYDVVVAHGEILFRNRLQHNVRGKWRRILTMGAADHRTLVRARAAIIEEFDDRRVARAFGEINRICHTHHDYMWDILV